MDIMVREAVLTDAKGIALILRQVGWFEHINAEKVEDTTRRVYDRLRLCQLDASHTVYVAEGDDLRLMGYAAVHWLPYQYLSGLEGYVSELYIDKNDRGRGVGTLILESVKREGQLRGASRLMLINMKNQESYHREFYIKQGWKEAPGAANFVLDLAK